MKRVLRKSLLTIFCSIFAVCGLFLAATAVSNKVPVNADAAALEAEFTNDGEFAITASRWNNTFSFIDGTSVGGTGAVLQANYGGATGAAFKLDLSPMSIYSGAIDSIVIKVKAANFTLGSDEFRTIDDTSSSWVQYGKTDDLSNWFNYTLNASSLNQFTTNGDGTIGYVNIAIRSNNSSLVMYVDSITVNTNPYFIDFTNDGQFNLSSYNNAAFQTVSGSAEGLPSGYDGAVLKVNNNGGWACVNVDFSASNIPAKNVDSIVVRIYSPGYTAADEFRTVSSDQTKQRMYGVGAKDMSTWCDITLSADSIGDMTNAFGYLTTIAMGVRVKSSATVYYIDSITVNTSETHAATTKFIGFTADQWNNLSSNGSSCNIIDFDANPLGDASNATNLAATFNPTSLMVKYNGNTFYSLYLDTNNANRTKYNISYAHGTKHFYFAIPEADLVDGATLEVEDGTPFMNYYLSGVKITYDATTGKWINYNPAFVQTNATYNNDSNGFFIAEFDTTGWAQNGVPTSYSGITYNGNDITDLTSNIKFYGTSSVWFTYTKQANNPKLAADYNGYSHPTIAFEEGATMVYNEKTYTFHAVTFYLDFTNNKWTTTIPDGYYDHIDIEEATFAGVWGNADGYNSPTSLLLRYTSTATWDHTNKGTIASKITYRNSSTSASTSPTNSNITGWSGQKWMILSGLSGYDVIEIAEGGTFGGNIEIPSGTFYLVNGRWVNTAPHASNTNYTGIHSTWNNYAVGDGSSGTIVTYDVNPLGDAVSYVNLAATLNRTSLMVKYNGSTFFELYQTNTKYTISYAHTQNRFYFTVPEADLVDGATLEVEDGTPFMNYYLGEVTLVYNASSGQWQLPVNYNPSFVSINGSFNNESHGYFIVQFNTTGWAQSGVPTSYSGITYNGNDITDLITSIQFYQEHSVWFTYTVQASNAKLAANYNGYSHPTIAFAEGATMVYGGNTYTFHAVTFYLNLSTNKWQTEVPAGYYDHIDTAVFSGVWGSADGYNSSTSLLLKYTSTATWDHTNKGTLSSKITYRNSSTSASYSATDSNITGWDGQKWIILSGLSGYDVIEIAEGGMFGGAIEIPAGTFYLVNGRWVNTASHASNTVFTTIHATWNNYAAGNSTSGTILTYSVNPLGDAVSYTNLAATPNRTSLMVKYNGETFFDLYSDTSNANRAKYTISYTHGNGFFYFTVPEADLVDGATLEVEDGTPFMNYYLEGVTITYNATSGKWQVPVNYNPSFVSINGSFNNDSNGFFIAQFNTTGWAQDGVPTSYSGITYNGNNITDLATTVKFYQNHSVWFIYTVQASNPKLVANYNGYSHPTIAFAEGATMVYGGETYTFHAVTFYLNLSTNKWQTAVPDGYVVRNALNYSSVNASYNNNKNIASGYSCTLIQFSGTIGSYTGTNLASTLGAYISVGGATLNNISGAVLQIGYNGSYTNCLFVKVPVSALVIDNTSKVVELSIADYITGDTVLCGVDLYLVDGVWVTSYSATIRTFVGELWQCNDYSQNYELTSYIGRDNVFALLNYDVYIFDGVETTVYTNYITAINDVGNKIKINGTTPLKDEPLAKVYLLNAHMVIAVPSCDYVTIEEGTYFLGQLLGAATIYYTGGTWESSDPSAEAVEMSLAATSEYIEIPGVRWNNFDYNGYGVTLGYENNTGIPANGMVLLLEFAESSLVDQPNRTSWANQIGAYSKVGNGFKINGVSLKNVSNAYVGFMLGGNKLYFYIPFDSIDEADFYTFTVDADTEILYSTLPAVTLYFYDRAWHDVAPKALVINYAAESISINKRIGSSVTVNSDYLTEVLSSRLENAIVLAWTIGGNDYFYGDSSTLSVSATVTITSLVDFYTVDGASVRMAADGNTGLRFESRIRNADLASLISTYDSVELGTYIAPRYMIDNYLSTNPSNTFKDYFAQAQGSGNATKYLKIANVNSSGNVGIYNRDTYESDGYIRYYGSMVNIYDVNYYTKFVGIGYIKIVKGGNTYIVFGATSLSKITRTVYDVVKAAYSDTTVPYTVTQLNTLAGFMNEVCDLSFRNGNLSINNTVTGRNYTPAYSSSVNGGVCYIARSASVKMPGVIVINGKKVSVSNFIDNTQSGYLILAITSSNMSALFNDGIVYGIGEPCIDLWPNNNTVATPEMLATIADEMNATAFRIWLQGEFASVNSSNEVSLNSSLANALENYIGQLVSHGVKEIYLMGLKYMPAKDYPTYYCTNKSTSTNEWISVNTFGNGSNYTLICYDINCVPDPSTEAEAYATWLKIQYDAYDLLTSSIASWKTEHSWADDVKFYFEGLNEPEGQSTVHRRGYYTAGVYSYTYFDNAELAKIHTDVAYYMTLAVNDNLSGIGFVTTPALTNLTTTCGNSLIQSNVYVDTLLLAMAAAIKDNVAPTAIDGITPVNTTDPEDYFTVLNWHPYLSWWKDENADIYYGEIKTTKTWYGSTTTEGVVNADYVSQWVNWNNNIYHLFVDQFNNYTPKVVLSEFGAMDYGTDYASNQRWTKLGINETLAGQVFYNLVTAIENTDFKANCTVLGFRMCDTESLILADQGGVHNLYSAGEGNIGFIEENGVIKATMKKYYYIINGSNDTSALQTVVSSFYD